MKIQKFKTLPLLLLLAVVIIFSGCSKNSGDGTGTASAEQTDQLEQILRDGTLKVGLSTFVPWAMLNKSGELVGFEVDVANKLAEDIGVEIEFIQTKWSGIIPALLTGKFDIIIGGMSVTPERNISVNFTDAYEYSGQSIVANLETAGGLTSLDDFNNGDIVIAVRTGSTGATAAKTVHA